MSETFEDYPSLAKRDDESSTAYQAFIDYISLGWERSLDLDIFDILSRRPAAPAGYKVVSYADALSNEILQLLGA